MMHAEIPAKVLGYTAKPPRLQYLESPLYLKATNDFSCVLMSLCVFVLIVPIGTEAATTM